MDIGPRKTAITEALGRFEGAEARQGATELLAALGYESERTLETTGAPSEFFGVAPSKTSARVRMLDDAKAIHILFQYTDEEVRDAGAQGQLALFPTAGFDGSHSNGFLFTVVELRNGNAGRGRGRGTAFSRTDFARMTREVNRAFAGVPAVVLFRVEGRLTVGFVGRRQHERDVSRDVLDRASLIKDIDLRDPHRAHVDMLADLSLPRLLNWMETQQIRQDFEALHQAWLAKLDTEELNRRFYRELFAWFELAVSEARFPVVEGRAARVEENVIRLITRLMFVWFMKEKGLVAEELFVESRVAPLLKDYDAEAGDSYYRAVLQNLFFATLNTEIGSRGFGRGVSSGNSHYRYKDLIARPNKLLALFEQTPFINGGLFECLDVAGGALVDCYSDAAQERSALSLPNRLFFGNRGLVTLFERYRFTVEENTPIEREVALDPELLGSVFENLLAAFNPETRESARRHTGSYYTPRPVVDYMVRESIALAITARASGRRRKEMSWMDRIRRLVDESTGAEAEETSFDEEETRNLVSAIAEIKLLDPAVGSGAFPMTALHVLTLALRRLDPQNAHWEHIQQERAAHLAARAYKATDDEARKLALREVESTFRRYRDSDFGRKLYLIQNSLFGVDIQAIACQIAKLRFFISLAIEQEASDNKEENYGIRPLPNLETRFIAADSLLSVGNQPMLEDQAVGEIEDELRLNREHHFNARRADEKRACRERDGVLRGRLGELLEAEGFGDDHAAKVAAWDPYEQNAVAEWFDPEYMFGVKEFDVVVGNPPYIQLQKNGGEMRRKYQNSGYDVFASTGDVYQLFFERGMKVLRAKTGILAYITSNSWLKAEYGRGLRRYFAGHHTPLTLVEMGKDVFENAIVDTAVLIARRGKERRTTCRAVDMDLATEGRFPPPKGDWGTLETKGERPWMALSSVERAVMEKMEALGTPLGQWDISIFYGIKTGYNAAFIVDQPTRDALVAADPKSAELLKPVLRGRDIARYRAKWAELWLIDTHNGYADVPPIDVNDYPAVKRHLDRFGRSLSRRQDQGVTPYNLRNCAYHEEFRKTKLFWMHMAPHGRFALAEKNVVCNQKCFMVTGRNLEYLCAVLNSTLVTWLVSKIAVTTGMGLPQWDKFTVSRVPVVNPDQSTTGRLQDFVGEMLLAIDRKDAHETSKLQQMIDHCVFALYDLTPDEINSVSREGNA